MLYTEGNVLKLDKWNCRGAKVPHTNGPLCINVLKIAIIEVNLGVISFKGWLGKRTARNSIER